MIRVYVAASVRGQDAYFRVSGWPRPTMISVDAAASLPQILLTPGLGIRRQLCEVGRQARRSTSDMGGVGAEVWSFAAAMPRRAAVLRRSNRAASS